MSSTELTLEQQFTLANAKQMLETQDAIALRSLYCELLKHHLQQKNYYCELLKHQWGLDGEPNKRPTEEERRDEGTNYQAS